MRNANGHIATKKGRDIKHNPKEAKEARKTELLIVEVITRKESQDRAERK